MKYNSSMEVKTARCIFILKRMKNDCNVPHRHLGYICWIETPIAEQQTELSKMFKVKDLDKLVQLLRFEFYLSSDWAVRLQQTRVIYKLLLVARMSNSNLVGSYVNPSLSYGKYEKSASLSSTKHERYRSIVEHLLDLSIKTSPKLTSADSLLSSSVGKPTPLHMSPAKSCFGVPERNCGWGDGDASQ